MQDRLSFGVLYFNTFSLKGTIMEYKFILFSPWGVCGHQALGPSGACDMCVPLRVA